MSDLPCDTEPPADLTADYAALRHRIARFKADRITDLEAERNRRDIARAVTNWLPADKPDGAA